MTHQCQGHRPQGREEKGLRESATFVQRASRFERTRMPEANPLFDRVTRGLLAFHSEAALPPQEGTESSSATR